MTPEIDLRLSPDPESVPRARRALDPLAEHVEEPVLERARLLVSELVTNAIRHAEIEPHDRIGLTVSVQGDRLRAEVRNPRAGFTPHPQQPTMFQQSGWGLYLVGQLADRWGVKGSCVWFEIDGLGPAG